MATEAQGKYRRKRHCCYLAFRIIAFVLSLVCLAFSIALLVAPLATWKTTRKSPKSSSSTSPYEQYYLFGYKEYDSKDEEFDSMDEYDLDEDSAMSKVYAMQGLGVVTVVLAAIVVLFALVYLILLCVFQCQRRAADKYRDEVYAAAVADNGEDASSARDGDSAPYGRHEASGAATNGQVLYLHKSDEEVVAVNQKLKTLRHAEQRRRSANAGVGGTLLVLLVLLCICALITVVLFAHVKSTYLGPLAFSTGTVSYDAGFILGILVICLSFVLIVLLAIPCIEGLGCCAGSSVRDVTFVVKQMEPVAMEALPVQPVTVGKKVETNNSTPRDTAVAGPTGSRVYGVPMTAAPTVTTTTVGADRGPAVTYYRELGLPAPAYEQADGRILTPK